MRVKPFPKQIDFCQDTKYGFASAVGCLLLGRGCRRRVCGAKFRAQERADLKGVEDCRRVREAVGVWNDGGQSISGLTIILSASSAVGRLPLLFDLCSLQFTRRSEKKLWQFRLLACTEAEHLILLPVRFWFRLGSPFPGCQRIGRSTACGANTQRRPKCAPGLNLIEGPSRSPLWHILRYSLLGTRMSQSGWHGLPL